MPGYTLISDWLYYLLLILYVITIGSCIFVVLSENRNPVKTLAWIVALIFLPVGGLLFYLFFGRSLRSIRLINRSGRRKLLSGGLLRGMNMSETNLEPRLKELVKLSDSLVDTPYTEGNEAKVFTKGDDKFDALKADLRNARKSINMQYYIFLDDELGREIANILMERARSGVRVRLIYDHVGSFSAKRRFFDRMRHAGVEAQPFFRVTFPQLANRINWRNHRKLTVIDDEIGYIGGMNVADRYVGENSWRDTHLRVKGPIVRSLLYSFAVDWGFMHEPMEIGNIEKSNPSGDKKEDGPDMGMQLVTSGPTDPWHSLTLCFLKAIATARKTIYLQTPYFLPPDALMEALETAALAKVDVRIMMPLKPDTKIIRYGSFSYITRCLNAGIKVYLYESRMMHSKMMVIDDEFVTLGSTNFDFRSFENNFEGNLFIYDKAFNRRMRDVFFSDCEKSEKITLAKWSRRPRTQRTMEALVRLFSPIL